MPLDWKISSFKIYPYPSKADLLVIISSNQSHPYFEGMVTEMH